MHHPAATGSFCLRPALAVDQSRYLGLGTKRAYESSDDASRVFRKMLEGGEPPDDWETLLVEAQAEG